MQLIALTGGIASGKSTVAARLAEHGAVIVDADRLAREVVEPGEAALGQIVDRFGGGVLLADGRLDRAALSRIVFSDDASRLALNRITHPAVWRRALELFHAAEVADPRAIVVYDVPLLVEASADRPLRFDIVVVVDAPAGVRVERLVAVRGMSREEAEARVGAQATDAERRAVADIVIDAGGTLDHTLGQADDLWRSLQRT